ncbi:MAG: hypothetical protein AAB434_11065 [Planctomycetota bacterium]
MRMVWVVLLALGIHAAIGALAHLPSIEKRIAVDRWDLLISLRADPPPLLMTHREGEPSAWPDRFVPADEGLEDEYVPFFRWRAAQYEWRDVCFESVEPTPLLRLDIELIEIRTRWGWGRGSRQYFVRVRYNFGVGRGGAE